ncbi:MAG: MBL fold metallo-hydrolase [Chloroflexi bacterium]|nr:MBL fold metallo-hydrolase [Chloroflexota bacterium]
MQLLEHSVTFIGNATLLLRFGDLCLLTDPNFIHKGEEVSIGYGLHATRQTNPACQIADLPPIDVLVLSHFHGDHFDQVAERELDKSTLIVTPPDAAHELATRGFTNVHPLKTWQRFEQTKNASHLRLTATPGKHGPTLVDFALPNVMGSVLELEDSRAGLQLSVYISGDTLVFDDLLDIPRRHPAIDLAFLHLGGTRVMGIMVTMDGKQGVELLGIVRPRHAIPIHYDDYDLFSSALSDFQTEVRAAGLEDRVTYLCRGDTYDLRRA